MAAPRPAERTYRSRLYDVALDQYGYVTTADARNLGIPVVELGKLAHRGKLERLDYGLYRVPEIRPSERAPYMEAVLWVGRYAALSHDAVLALHGLGFANPRTIRVVTPHRVRRKYPRRDITVIHAPLRRDDLTGYFGIPSTTVARALLDCADLIGRDRLLEAARDAQREGLLLRREHDAVVARVGAA